MTARLLACPACARHIRVDEERCPFCDTALPDGFGARLAPVPSVAVPARAGLVGYGSVRSPASAGVLVFALVSGVASATGCEMSSAHYGGPPPPLEPVLGAPDACKGQVYFEVPASGCGCSGDVAYALCDDSFGFYGTCTCANPLCQGQAGYKAAPGSPGEESPPVCDAGARLPNLYGEAEETEADDAPHDGSASGDAHEGGGG